MRIYITGSRGFVGQTLLKRLLDCSHQVTILCRNKESPFTEANLPKHLADNLQIHIGDLTRPSSIAGSLHEHDALIHLAGAVGYGKESKQCHAINVEGTENLLREAIVASVPRMIHMSTVAVYGRVAEQALNEDSPTRFTGDPYGDSKIRAEQIVQKLAPANSITWTILRPTVIYGPGDDKFLPKLIENLRHPHARYIASAMHPIDLIHVEDVVDFIELCLNDKRTCGQIYNLNHPHNPTWRQFIQTVCKLFEIDPPQSSIPYFAAYWLAAAMEQGAKITKKPPRLTRYSVRVVGRRYDYHCDRALALGFSPKVDIDQGLRSCRSMHLPTNPVAFDPKTTT